MTAKKNNPCSLYLPDESEITTPIKHYNYDGICYLGKESIAPYKKFYSKFKKIGSEDFGDNVIVDFYGINEDKSVAGVMSNDAHDHLVNRLENEGSEKLSGWVKTLIDVALFLIGKLWRDYRRGQSIPSDPGERDQLEK